MTPLRFAIRQIRRRKAYAALFALTLFLASTLLIGLAALEDSVRADIAGRARALAAGDLVIHADDLEPARAAIRQAWPGARTAESIDVLSMTRQESADRVEQILLKAVSPEYPLYGTVRLEDGRFLGEAIDPGKIVLDAKIAGQLGAREGDTLQIGELLLTAGGIVAERTEAPVSFFNVAPVVFISREDLDRSGLIVPGSRTRATLYARLPPDVDLLQAKAFVEARSGAGGRVTSWADDRPGSGRLLNRTFLFLNFVSFFTLILAGGSLAVIFNGLLKEEYASFGIIKALGQPFSWTVRAWLCWAGLLAAAGVSTAMASGMAVSHALNAMMADALGFHGAIELGLEGLAGSILPVLALTILVSVPFFRRISGMTAHAVLSAAPEWTPLSPRHRVEFGILAGAFLFLVAWHKLGGLGYAAWAVVGILVIGAVTAAAVVLFGFILDRTLRRARAPYLRFALRPSGGQGYGAVAASGLALTFGLIALIAVLEKNMTEHIIEKAAPDLPNAYFINIRPAERERFGETVRTVSGQTPRLLPLVRGRIVSVNGVPADDLQPEGEGDRITREFGFTYGDNLLPTDDIVAGGTLWDESVPGAQVSVFDEFRGRFGIDVGDRITAEVLGRKLDATVTSLRSIDRSRREPFFYFYFRPGLLEQFPHTFMGAATLGAADLSELERRIMAETPHVTVFDMRLVADLAATLLRLLARAVNLVGGVTVAASFLLLAAALYVSYLDLRREAVLYRTLGAAGGQLSRLYAVRFVLLGAITVLVGTAAAQAAGYAILTRVFSAGWSMHLPGWLMLGFFAAVLAVAGWVVRRAVATPPMEILRYE